MISVSIILALFLTPHKISYILRAQFFNTDHKMLSLKLSKNRLLNIGLSRSVVPLVNLRPFSIFFSLRNDFDELKNAKPKPQANRNAATFFDIDSLIANSPGLQDSMTRNEKFDNFAFGSSLRDPREVAKSINMFGPPAGRSVEVRGNFLSSSGALRGLISRDQIKNMQKIQSRFIRPAKLRKMKKGIWWKKNFNEQFHYLMINIKDAKRRGY